VPGERKRKSDAITLLQKLSIASRGDAEKGVSEGLPGRGPPVSWGGPRGDRCDKCVAETKAYETD